CRCRARCVFTPPTTTEIHTLSLHDALPILLSGLSPFVINCSLIISTMPSGPQRKTSSVVETSKRLLLSASIFSSVKRPANNSMRSEEHTSELQSRFDLVCRLLLANKKPKQA